MIGFVSNPPDDEQINMIDVDALTMQQGIDYEE